MKKQNAPQPPDTAPRDGSVILADFGWHYYLPTAWNEYDEKWNVVILQAYPMDAWRYDCWFENHQEYHEEMKSWIPLPPLSAPPRKRKSNTLTK